MSAAKTAPHALIATITLEGVEPRIWRTFTVESDIRLAELHVLIQRVMGWNDCHLHEFRVGERRYGILDPDVGPGVLDERRARLGKLLKGTSGSIRYIYDFGDNWKHTIEFQPSDVPIALCDMPKCLDGARACPPDDSGGIWNYAELLEILADPKRDDPEGIRGWVDPEFDPESFDVETVNARLAEPDVW